MRVKATQPSGSRGGRIRRREPYGRTAVVSEGPAWAATCASASSTASGSKLVTSQWRRPGAPTGPARPVVPRPRAGCIRWPWIVMPTRLSPLDVRDDRNKTGTQSGGRNGATITRPGRYHPPCGRGIGRDGSLPEKADRRPIGGPTFRHRLSRPRHGDDGDRLRGAVHHRTAGLLRDGRIRGTFYAATGRAVVTSTSTTADGAMRDRAVPNIASSFSRPTNQASRDETRPLFCRQPFCLT